MRCFIIAEAGVNHNGSLESALELVEVAANAGADAVKFQTFKAEKLVSTHAATAEYQKQHTGHTTQLKMLQALELSEEAHYKIALHCKDYGIEFMSTPFDLDSADFLFELGMKRFKIPSGEITHYPLLSHIAKKDLPIIMSTGMSSLDEVSAAVEVIKQVRNDLHYSGKLDEKLVLLHCTSNYPADMADINLKAMMSMAKVLNLPVGYSDHSQGILISPVAVALGACVIEKHFTLDKTLSGPDHSASLNPDELAQLIKNIRDVEMAMGDGAKVASLSELEVRDKVRRSVTLRCDKSKGTILSESDLELLRPGVGIPPQFLSQVVGKVLNQDLQSGTTLHWDHLSQ